MLCHKKDYAHYAGALLNLHVQAVNPVSYGGMYLEISRLDTSTMILMTTDAVCSQETPLKALIIKSQVLMNNNFNLEYERNT